MRSLKLAGLVALVLTTSCAVHISTDGSGNAGPRSRAQNAPARPAAAPPPAAPPAAAAPAPATTAAPRVGSIRRLGSGTGTKPAPAPSQTTAVRPTGIIGPDHLNLAKVQAIKARNPKACGYMEVSPNNWVHIDCDMYKPSVKSIPHLSARKLKLVKAHKTLFRPLTAYKTADHLKKIGRLGGKATTIEAAGPGGPPFGGPNQIAEQFPSTVDHRADNLEGPIKNQGGVGSCTAHSLSSALDNAAIRAKVLTPGDREKMSSPLHVWSRYGLPDMGAAADGNIAQPVAIYTIWPQSDREACMMFQANGSFAQECGETYGVKPGTWRSDPKIMAKYEKAQAEGIYKIASIEKLQVKPPDIEELLTILASGADIWAAFLIDGYAWSNKKMTNAVIPEYTGHTGGHAVVISGYRETPTGRQFLIHNSWGESWGEKGYAWVTENTVNKWLYYAYRVKITNGVPKELLTDDDCAPDELVDLGTGLCAVMCDPPNERPVNGCKN